MRVPLFRIQRLAVLTAVICISLACSLTDSFGLSTPTAAPVVGPTISPSCAPIKTAADEAALLYNAQVAEHNQPKIEIQMLTPKTFQRVAFIKPDKYLWHNEIGGGAWDEAMSIGGQAYARSSSSGWTKVDVLDETAAILMKTFTDPPQKGSGADLGAALTKAGITNPKFDARLVGYDATAFFGTCVYEPIIKSGDTVIYSQKTWIDPGTGLRQKFEAKDEHGNVMETRLFEYDSVKIDAP